jgi:hypothetical protein
MTVKTTMVRAPSFDVSMSGDEDPASSLKTEPILADHCEWPGAPHRDDGHRHRIALVMGCRVGLPPLGSLSEGRLHE